MTNLEHIFAELGISQYLQEFLEQGFDTWETILDITESDFDTLGVKLGHRRKLQRRIAHSRGISSDTALDTRSTPPVEKLVEEQQKTRTESRDGSAVPGVKRKYRRHPKADENAPERPPSAYVIFSNRMREELKGRNLSFTEIAKLVGEKWQNLYPSEKESYEQQASIAKEKYNSELMEYKKTNCYREYLTYLTEFKAKQSSQTQGDTDNPKRPKLEHNSSISNAGPAGSSNSNAVEDKSPRNRADSISAPALASVSCPWLYPLDNKNLSSRENPEVAVAMSMKKSSSHKSPQTKSPNILPGYRDSILTNNHQNISWREPIREESSCPVEQYPRLNGAEERRVTPPEQMFHSVPLQHISHSQNNQTHRPILSNNETVNPNPPSSSGSTGSSHYFGPRTPLQPPLDRPLKISLPYHSKSNENFERQLPPLKQPLLSPKHPSRDMLKRQHHSSTDIPRIIDIPPGQMHAKRGFGDYNSHRIREFVPGEIVNQNGRKDGVDCARYTSY
ncbi:hypothetical protein K3495_g7200 [Podosphaera aphanis]|nr:hypothetical protein K3495_g7200 [Podosphaera aphanis]